MIRATLQYVAANYARASTEPFTKHPVAHYLRHTAQDQIAAALARPTLRVRGSAGQSDWAEIPWVAVLDPVITKFATRGYYVVYLFSADLNQIVLCLLQGAEAVKAEFGLPRGIVELKRRAALMRSRVPEFSEFFSSEDIDLRGIGDLAEGYEAAHAFGTTYETAALPSEESLARDLLNIVRLYIRLTKRGGVDTLEEPEGEGSTKKEIIERRTYRYHRRIERNSDAGKEAKRIHGFICQGCGFDFEEFYGPIGREYIEAHHLLPLSELPEDELVRMDAEKDFAVLCANCHRMIHRKDAPKTIPEFREIVRR